MNIEGLDKAVVLAALYNGSHQQGMGFMHARGASAMTVEQARKELEGSMYFDYLHGRVMKVDLSGDEVFTGKYNRDNGPNVAEQIVAGIRGAQ